MSVRLGINGFGRIGRLVMRAAVESGRHDVEVVGEATNGDEAVSVTLEAHPDVLFMDVRMPGSDGLQALRKLRDKLPADVMPLVIFTTAYEEHAVEAFELEGTDYLVKPVDKAALARALKVQAVQVDRLLSLSHRTSLDTLDDAFRALGQTMTLNVRAVEMQAGRVRAQKPRAADKNKAGARQVA